MTSLLQPPGAKARSRKDLSASSIPTLVSLEEENSYSPPRLSVNGNGNDARKYSDSSLPSATAYTNLPATQKPTKASRRSSLGLGLLGGKSDLDKSGKRRSSIAVVFLGRRNSKVCSNWKRIGHFDTWWFNSWAFRNFTVERAGNRESRAVSEVIRIRHGKWSASNDHHHIGWWWRNDAW